MKKNVGNTDKAIRLLLAAVLAVLYFTGVISGTWATILLAVAAVLAVTGLINFCGLYKLFGINTCKVKPAKTDNK